MDTDSGTLEWIEKGVIAATVAQKPFTMGFIGLKLLDELRHHPPSRLSANWAEDPFSHIPRFVDTGVTVVDKSTVALTPVVGIAPQALDVGTSNPASATFERVPLRNAWNEEGGRKRWPRDGEVSGNARGHRFCW